jgi:large subunit ribosomal protein L1
MDGLRLRHRNPGHDGSGRSARSCAVTELKAGRIEFRTDKTGIVHAPIGKVSFGPEKLQANLVALLETLHRLKPSTAKGTYWKSVTISSSMGPGVRLDTSNVLAAVDK